ncbi:uncharacterized protein [Narcine bancroftii]|uniref:uncharacterized protein isoform X2 n=1 Tax=Narcine bancroftii TaxID=1343680 RepID=UPI003831A099
MRLQIFCSKISAGLILNFLFLLPNITARSPDRIYFSNSVAIILLKGPDNPENGNYILTWRPHSGQRNWTLGTFYKDYWDRWRAEWHAYFGNNGFYQTIQRVHAISSKIVNPTFKFAGLLTFIQTFPKEQLLKKYELFGLKVEVSAQRPELGSDITLSCSISRFPNTVSLNWRQRDSSQQNRRNTEQICLNDTVYLMVQHIAVEDEKLFVCEVQENGTVVHTIEANFAVTELYQSHITLFRSVTDHSEFLLICYYSGDTSFSYAKWTWTSHFHETQEKRIANGMNYEAVNVDRTYFKNRLETIMPKFNGKNFSARIVPVLFEDAGVYKCSMDWNDIVIIKLITVKVTAEPSNAVTEGDTVNLTCSVSKIVSSMRLIWINADDKAVREKKMAEEEKSLSVMIQKTDRGRGNWRCGLLYKDKLHLLVPYYLEPSGSEKSIYFFRQEGNFVLKGPDNPGNDSIVWEWWPHTGQQTTQRLATFHREDQRWVVQWNDEHEKTPDISQRMRVDWGTLNLRIRKPTFELAGLFTWNQTHPDGKILRQWEAFGIKVEADSHRPVIGSDITLCCTISRLSDTVSLHWKPRGSSKQGRGNSADQIHLNNTIYLLVRHVGVGSPHLYTWEVRENGSTVLTGDPDIEEDWDLNNKEFTVYRSDANDSELNLICGASAVFTDTKWTWRSQRFQNQVKDIASTRRYLPINVNRSYFGNRLEATVGNLSGMNFILRIIPVQFEDAGVYTCSIGTYKYVTVELITVKGDHSFKYTRVVISGCLALFLIIILVVVLSLRKCKLKDLRNKRQKPLQSTGSMEDNPHLYSNPTEIHRIQTSEEKLVPNAEYMSLSRKTKKEGDIPEASNFAEYSNVNKKPKQEDTEDIHYGTLSFQNKAPDGHRHGLQSPSNTNLVSSEEDEPSVIYAQIA